jgi:acetoin utilization protein AcuC
MPESAATALVYAPSLDAYDLGPGHPLRPERVSLAVTLTRAFGMVADGALEVVMPRPATREEILRVHGGQYVATVIEASSEPGWWVPRRGIGPGDTPEFAGMHDASALVAGATTQAIECVVSGTHRRGFSPAGGLHHAHRDRAAGFCVYNDVAIGIAAAIESHPDLRVLYLDIDAHHGDGVQEAFYEEPRVLTISIHEDGRYLYPGTGSARESGEGAGAGFALNVPMPPQATDECYLMAFERVVRPAARAFEPDIIVTQNGADAHWGDPLTSLGLTVPGYTALFGRNVGLAEELCHGRLVACGGGGYSWATVVPRIWTLLGASLIRVTPADELPPSWCEQVRTLGYEPPPSLRHDEGPPVTDADRASVLRIAEKIVDDLARERGL